MKRKHVFTALAAFLALGIAPAWAEKDGTANEEARRPGVHLIQQGGPGRQPPRGQPERGDPRGQGQRADANDRRGPDWNRGNARQSYGRDNRFRDYDREAYYQPERNERRGAGPDRRFYRGDRLPQSYRDRRYVVDDWQGHRLSPPPRGYHWVQSGSDYLLVAIATGVILQLLLAR